MLTSDELSNKSGGLRRIWKGTLRLQEQYAVTHTKCTPPAKRISLVTTSHTQHNAISVSDICKSLMLGPINCCVMESDRNSTSSTVLVTGGNGLVGSALRWAVTESKSTYGPQRNETWVFLRRADGDLRFVFLLYASLMY